MKIIATSSSFQHNSVAREENVNLGLINAESAYKASAIECSVRLGLTCVVLGLRAKEYSEVNMM